jgi:hypothetical protein
VNVACWGSPQSLRQERHCGPYQTAHVARTFVGLLVALLSVPANAEIYKCTAKTIPTYQNFPCEFDSLGASSISDRSAAATPTPAPGVPRAAAASQARPSAPRVGMTSDEVKAIWGEPTNTNKEEFVKGTVETWTYADSRSIQFDRRHRVISIQW